MTFELVFAGLVAFVQPCPHNTGRFAAVFTFGPRIQLLHKSTERITVTLFIGSCEIANSVDIRQDLIT